MEPRCFHQVIWWGLEAFKAHINNIAFVSIPSNLLDAQLSVQAVYSFTIKTPLYFWRTFSR